MEGLGHGLCSPTAAPGLPWLLPTFGSTNVSNEGFGLANTRLNMGCIVLRLRRELEPQAGLLWRKALSARPEPTFGHGPEGSAAASACLAAMPLLGWALRWSDGGERDDGGQYQEAAGV